MPDTHARTERVTAASVWVATWCGFLAIGAVLPVLPRYVQGPIGAGDVAVGVVVGAFAISAVLGRPIAGRLADQRGRKPIMVIGLALLAASNALLLIDGGVAWLIVVRLIVGIADGWLFTSAVTWVLDTAPEDRRGQSIGLFGIAVWGGLSVGSVIGEATLRWASFDAVWVVSAVLPLVGLALITGRRDVHVPVPVDTRPSFFAVPRAAVSAGLALMLANIGFAAMVGFVVLHLQERSVAHAASAFTVFAAAVVITRVVFGQLPDRLGAQRTAMIAFTGHAVGMAIIALASSVPTAILGALLMGSGFALLFPSLALVVVDRVDERERGAALGAFTAFFDLGVGIGGPLAGAVAAASGYAEAFWVGVACAVLGGVVAVRAARTPAAVAATSPTAA